jgi:branched-chain amino acid transport system substrate-binding protein
MNTVRTLCSLFGLSVAFVIGASSPSEAQEAIRIGATMSLTGAYSTQGVPARNGYLLCQKHVNEKGGILGRKIEFLIFDDKSDAKIAPSLYEKLIVEDKVDAVMGPYGSPLTEAVAPVTEKHRKVMLTPLAATTSIWEQGRRYIFMQLAPSELFLAGLIDIGARNGLKTVALITEDTIFPKSAAKGTIEFAKKKGMDVVIHEEYAKGNKDFSAILAKVKAANPDVLGIASANLSDYIIVARQMKELDINVKMFGNTSAVAEFQQELGKTAEFAYGTSAWEPSLPYPGVKEFVEAYQKEFNKPPSFHAAGAYAGCQLFMEAARLAGSLDSDKLREQLLKLKTRTIFADYAVDARGFQTANKGLYVQWQDGKKVVVWPDELASAKPRFPTPPWSQR